MRLALSTGDPAGIGPEICAKAAQSIVSTYPQAQVSLFGDPRLFPDPLSSRVQLHPLACPSPVIPGRGNTDNASYVTATIEAAVAAVRRGQADALVTAPIAKSVLYAAGFAFPGHTEFLGHLAGNVPTHMMLTSQELRVVPVTLHQSLKSAIEDLSIERIEGAAQAAHQALRDWFGIAQPRLAICGLNPHAGENGALGREDEEIVRPAVAILQASGIDARGPLPADTLFHAAARETYDCALGLYHDQVLIPIKALAFDTGVNLTLGLPFIRTSPDHGTAFDIAGQGQANPSSMIAAMKLAMDLAAASAQA